MDIGIRLTGNHRDSLIADLIAEERDILNAGHIEGINLYHFHVRRQRNHRSKRSLDETIEDLKRDERIEFIAVGKPLIRQKREFEDNDRLTEVFKEHHQSINSETDNLKLEMSFDDVLYSKQWYLENKGQLGTPSNHDLNIAPAWRAGYCGKGITICIVDDGLDHPHPELADHYQPQFSYDLNDLNDLKHDPAPRTYDGQNNHGTRCAGAACGKANNELCGVGVAYCSNSAGIRVLDGRVTTLLEARALTLFAADIHIKSASWGPTDDGTKLEAPGHLVNEALNYGVTKGRHGKGLIYVWAAGNGGGAGDDCGADGYVSHHNVISIGSINHLGKSTYFGERCTSTMAVAYTGGKHSKLSDETTMPIGVVAPDVGGKCTTSFFGTSGAAPVAAGAFALVLEANSELGYRDLMYIVALTARIPTLSETDDWIINGAGFHVSDRFGFGVLDVGQMTSLAQNWTNVQSRYECYHESKRVPRELKIGRTVEISINVKECENVSSIEHVVANLSYSFHRRGDVKITLISPSLTPSELISYRDKDATNKSVEYFPFMSVHCWGESPIGRWTLRMETRDPENKESIKSALEYGDVGELSYFGLRIYGSNNPDDQNHEKSMKREHRFSFVPTQNDIELIYKREFAARTSPNIMQKRHYQNFIKQRQIQKQQEKNKIQQDRSYFGFFRRMFGF
ncbi:unnamed protein product [Rotaria sordida]|uniref:P/Homo B domain-containing protein n=1 Tax=Rotaria sordida TaxID=392033 RepID=A0A814SC55_9BILA|nr:unnamed protein product [Rotaria sordida]